MGRQSLGAGGKMRQEIPPPPPGFELLPPPPPGFELETAAPAATTPQQQAEAMASRKSQPGFDPIANLLRFQKESGEKMKAVSKGMGEAAIGGEVTGLALQGLGGLLGKLVSTAKAAAKFQQIEETVGGIVPDISKAVEKAQIAKDLGKYGKEAPPQIKKLLRAVSPAKGPKGLGLDIAPEPLPYSETFKFASALKDLSRTTRAGMSGAMKKAVGDTARELQAANRGVAESAGLGQTFDEAMKGYRRAKEVQKLQELLTKKAVSKTLEGVGIGAGMGAGASLIYKLFQ